MVRVYLLILSVSILGACTQDPSAPVTNKKSVFQMLTGESALKVRQHWDSLFSAQGYVYGRKPAPFLKKVVGRLPKGRVLDLAMGEGRNAVYLAKKGFQVVGVYISEVALRKANRMAKENRVTITTLNHDLRTYTIEPQSYEVILNINYLQRDLIPKIIEGLKPGGMVVFQNYTMEHLKNPEGQNFNADYLLNKGELKEAFSKPEMEILEYQEANDGRRAQAKLLARKR